MRPYIPNHIIFGDILPLVPSEKLKEWKVACKSWYCHLHLNPSYFIRDQLAKSRRSHIFDIGWIEEFHREHKLDSTALDVEFKLDSSINMVNCISRTSNLTNVFRNIGLPSNETFIIGSCHGLVLVNRYGYSEFYLINPSTKQWVTLPLPYKQNMRPVHASFCYDKSRDKYKVLLFNENNGYKCKVQTLGSKSWKSVILPYDVRGIMRRSVIMDGYINFLCNIDTYKGVFDHLLAFDIGRETFQLSKLPTIAFHILNVRENLAMVPIVGSSYMYYKLDDRDNGTWIKEYSISTISSTHFIHPNRYFPLTTCNNGNTFIFKEVVGQSLFSFDNETSTYKQIKTFWDRNRNRYSIFSCTFNHVDTLLSPYTVTSKKRKNIEDPDSAIPLRRSLRLQKKVDEEGLKEKEVYYEL